MSVLLFVLILFINLLFWFSWIKLTFSDYYQKLHKYLSKYLCFKKSKQGAVNKGENDKIGDESEFDFSDVHKVKENNKAGMKNQRSLDESEGPAMMGLAQIDEDEENFTNKGSKKKATSKKDKNNTNNTRATKKSRKAPSNLDDSQRYALAHDDSSRYLDESARQDVSHLFISGGTGVK